MNPAEANKYATLERLPDSDIYVLTLQSKIMDVPMTRAIHHHLDTLELTTGPCCMISTAAHPKIFSAGLNFDTFKGHPIEVHNRLREIARLFGRMLQLPFPTISAINGECYAGGYMFATTHDFRFMRDDYGKICLPEINLGIPLPRAFNAVVQARVPIQHYSKMALLGKKYSPQEALEFSMIDRLSSNKNLMSDAIEYGKTVADKARFRDGMRAIKAEYYRDTIEICRHRSVDQFEFKIYQAPKAKL